MDFAPFMSWSELKTNTTPVFQYKTQPILTFDLRLIFNLKEQQVRGGVFHNSCLRD